MLLNKGPDLILTSSRNFHILRLLEVACRRLLSFWVVLEKSDGVEEASSTCYPEELFRINLHVNPFEWVGRYLSMYECMYKCTYVCMYLPSSRNSALRELLTKLALLGEENQDIIAERRDGRKEGGRRKQGSLWQDEQEEGEENSPDQTQERQLEEAPNQEWKSLLSLRMVKAEPTRAWAWVCQRNWS